MIHIALVDDHSCLRKGFASFINKSRNNIRVILEAGNGREFLEQLEQCPVRPDICILDIDMPVMNGYQTLRELRKKWPSIKVITMSTLNHEYAIINMVRLGARAYLLKSVDPDELMQVVIAVHRKGFYNIDLIDNYPQREAVLPELKPKEMEFLVLCCNDLTYAEIARKMGVSPRTVEGYRDDLFKKFQIHTRAGLVLFAMQVGFASPTIYY